MSRKKLKIAILVDQLVPGGVQKDAANEVSYLRKFGRDAKLLVLMKRGWRPKYQSFFPKVPTQFLSDSYPEILRNSYKFPVFTFFSTLHVLSPYLAPAKIKPLDFDIIVAHGTTTCLTALAIWKKHRIPYIAIINDPMEYILKKVYSQTPLRFLFWVISPILFYLEKQIIENAKTAVILSEKHLPYMQKSYKITPEILIPGTIPLTKLPTKKQDYLIASSRWETSKNPYLLLEIAKLLKNVPIVVAGNWTDKKDLLSFKKKIDEEKLDSIVTLKTDILPKDLLQLYRGAIAWVHPNVEAFGLGGFEAASCGTPIVMPAGSGLSQILKDKKDGFFLKKTRAEEFARVLSYLIKNPKIARRMGKSAWQAIKEGHSWQNHTKQLEGLIIESIKRLSVVALETGHAQGTVISGGDKLLEEMSTYLTSDISLTVIIPQIASWHWKGKNAKVISLGKTTFDNNATPIAVFINYLLRIVKTSKILLAIKNKEIIYSSTNVFPDVVPAYFAKLLNPKLKWFARIHHLSPSPFRRPGNLLVNLGSNILQELSLYLLHKKTDKVAALNPNLYQTLIKRGFPEDKLLVVTAGINTEKWVAKENSPKKFDGVFLGRLHPAKGAFDLLPIWKQVVVNIPSAKLAIIGHGSSSILRSLKSQIKKSRFEQNIKVLGPLSGEMVKRYLNDSKIFLFTDHEAGFGLAATEAMSMGLPVVGYDIGILGKVFKEGYIKIKPYDTHNFANTLVNLLQNDRKQETLSFAAHLEAQKHDWQKVATNFQKILFDLKFKS